MIIIAGYTLISLVLIGRGVFCGWLCPFGALQELLGRVRARSACRNRIPRTRSSGGWMGKYIAAAAVLLLVMTEIDPLGRQHRDRAVQDRDHLEVCAPGRISSMPALLAIGLFPNAPIAIPVSARWRPGGA
jgi:hypothetical protein